MMKPLAAVVFMLVFVVPAGSGDDSGILDRQLVGAASRGDLGAVEALIAAGADEDAGFRVPRDMTAACTNCASGSVPTTAHPPTPEPLHLAAAHGIDPEVVWQHEAGGQLPVLGERKT